MEIAPKDVRPIDRPLALDRDNMDWAEALKESGAETPLENTRVRR